jgi:hypothetical protein
MPNALAATALTASAALALAFAGQGPAPAAAQAPAVPASAPPQAATVATEERRTAASLDAAIQALVVRHPARVARSTIGSSFGKRPIHLLTLSADLSTADSRPSILLLAGMDGERWSSTEAALVAAESLAAAEPGILGDVTVYVVPRGNPDAAEAFSRTPRRAYSGNDVYHDNDRDGAVDEDAPRDLDGNGVITQLRARGVPEPWHPATMVSDPAAPRLMRAPEAASGQLPEWTVWAEGIDADGDGRISEDWPGGIDPERNFPHRWPEFEDEAGQYPLFAPESRGLAEFVTSHRNLVAAMVIGRHDTVVNLPDPKAKTPSGMHALIHPDDMPAYEDAAKAWRTISGQKRAEGRDAAGSFMAWMNAQRGIPTFATTLWGRPDAPKAEGKEQAKEEAKEPAPAPADAEAAAWLEYSDRARGGTGFVPWTKVEHPQVKDAEVGGWVPGFRENPPLEEVAPLGRSCAAFIQDLAARRPKVALSRPSAKELSPGLWQVDATVSNAGRLPTAMRGGREEGILPAHVVRLSVPATRIKGGRKLEVIRGLDPGQVRRLSWVVAAPAGEDILLELTCNGARTSGWSIRGGTVAEAAAGGTR